jgi:hypothetical protein
MIQHARLLRMQSTKPFVMPLSQVITIASMLSLNTSIRLALGI